MSNNDTEWKATVARLLALGTKLEGQGQYNVAKLVRAAADALTRRAAYHLTMPELPQELAGEVEGVAAALSALGVEAPLVAALRQGAVGLREHRLTMVGNAPHPYVCRTCGLVLLAAPEEPCPTCGARPATFQRFLPVYWLDALEPAAILQRLRQTPDDVAELLAGLPEARLARQPAGGGWSMRQTLSHMLDAQRLLEYRLQLLLSEDNPSLTAQAVFDWATEAGERLPTTAELFADYARSRAETLGRLEKLPLDGWQRAGVHQEFGPVTLRQQASYFAVHEITHLPQMERGRG